jgi:hypothetical protein
MRRATVEDFDHILDELRELHLRKSKDYGSSSDPYANVRHAAELFRLPAWVSALIRASDKIARLAQFAQRGWLANESAEDSLMDLAVYAIIALLLYREANGKLPDR